MERRIYPKPPIVEAIIELRFAGQVDRQALVDAMVKHHGEDYSGQRRAQEFVKVTAAVLPESAAAEVQRIPHADFLTSPSGLRVIGCRDNVLSFHVLAPYPGWENFRDHVRDVLSRLPKGIADLGVEALAVRYIDRIVLPEPGASPGKFFLLLAGLPNLGPSNVAALHFLLERSDPDSGLETALMLRGDNPESDGRPAFVFDFLAVQKTPAGLKAGDESAWWPTVEILHKLQRESFEASITEPCRELFQ